MMENIHEPQEASEIIFEIISGQFARAEIKLFQTDVDEGWNNNKFILDVTTVLFKDSNAILVN